MGLNTYPYNPFPASTDKLDEAHNEQIQAEIDQVKNDVTNLNNEIYGDAVVYPYASSITIENAVPSNLDGCVVKIEPVQSGSGDPSPENVRPITGHTEAVIIDTKPNMYVDGTAQVKNVSNFDTDNTVLASTSSELTVSGNKVSGTTTGFKWLHVPYHFVKGKTIYCDMNDTVRIRISSSTGTKVELFVGVHLTYTPSETFDGFVDFAVANNATLSNTKFGISLTSNYDIDDYNKKSPYYTLALGDTIYGGTVDFNSGVMTVDRAIGNLADLSWTRYDVNLFTAEVSGKKPAQSTTTKDNIVCSCYDTRSVDDVMFHNADSSIGGASSNNKVFVRDSRYDDATDLTTALSGQTFVYELATPTTIQLTPTQIQLLKGQNTLTASTGQISVTVNGVSGAIGSLQTQTNDTDEALAELAADIADQLPTAPTTDGAYVLTVTVESGTPTYSWEIAE